MATRLVEETDRDGVALIFPSKTGTREVILLFNRTGKVGGEIRVVSKDAHGRVLSSKNRLLAETVTPQKGVLLK